MWCAADLALTGDASDELLGGYSFTWRAEDPVWSEKRAQMCSTWTFSAPTLAEALSVPGSEAAAGAQPLAVFSPYMHESFSKWALENTTKNDCVREREVRHSGIQVAVCKAIGLCLPSLCSFTRFSLPLATALACPVLLHVTHRYRQLLAGAHESRRTHTNTHTLGVLGKGISLGIPI